MNNLESFSSQEKAREISTQTELINQTEVSKFELSNLASTEDIAEYIKETIPQSHLENCSAIRYEPVPNELYPNAKGTFERDTHQICIWGEQFAGPQELIATMTHEIGHNVHENIINNNPEIANKWSDLHQQSLATYQEDGFGFVTDYARTSQYEDFADSYLTYIGDPEKLQFYNPDKYEFMKENVFAGEEYLPRLSGGYYIKEDGSYDWNLFNEQGEPNVLFCCDCNNYCSYDPNGCSP
ncbi:hypothetical protein PA905_34250 [Planktothrix agardhii CCAP 1459/11A]|uniref:Uncharacterized protein n=1 Tax=Planktothrix agardhii CCAP 1459/11A TaxID=282420 RepID=A0A4P5ZGA6_PLAAG|nr:hypothetical protein [Planktothrix agardhii]GDZ95186.1 hypothetical protein PA905_34250 [Planktothrix agardhii CCAP 1459/11A]